MKNNRLLIVDDEQSIINCVTRQLRNEEYEIYSASSGEAGLRLIENKNIGVVISDFNMPGMTGIDFLNRVKKIRSNIVRILFTAYASMENAINAINNVQIFRYMTKPWSQEEINRTVKQAFEYYNLAAENERMQKEIAEKNRQLQSINENLEHLVSKRTSLLEDSIREGVVMLAMAAEAKDDDTGDHLKRIALLTKEVCLAYGLSNEQSEKISFFSVMHDIGKIHIPDTILQKNGPLDPDEWEIMRTHCIAGEKILGEKPFYKTAREIARSHHERWDGTGYPDGLSENSIPLSARIVSIADVFDALTNKRKYKEAWSV
ncbi:MAG: response regulator [Desulfatiglans sp.]|nr:response regulator [Desulfatiglans sp.]